MQSPKSPPIPPNISNLPQSSQCLPPSSPTPSPYSLMDGNSTLNDGLGEGVSYRWGGGQATTGAQGRAAGRRQDGDIRLHWHSAFRGRDGAHSDYQWGDLRGYWLRTYGILLHFSHVKHFLNCITSCTTNDWRQLTVIKLVQLFPMETTPWASWPHPGHCRWWLSGRKLTLKIWLDNIQL